MRHPRDPIQFRDQSTGIRPVSRAYRGVREEHEPGEPLAFVEAGIPRFEGAPQEPVGVPVPAGRQCCHPTGQLHPRRQIAQGVSVRFRLGPVGES